MSTAAEKSSRVSVRVSDALVERLDDLAGYIVTQPHYAPSGSVSRSDALRIALLLGVEELERQRAELARATEQDKK